MSIKKSNCMNLFIRFFIALIPLIIISCPQATDVSDNPAAPPAQVQAHFNNGKLIVTWLPVKGATGYQVYRKIGESSFSYYAAVNTPEFNDQNYNLYPADQTVMYAVTAISAGVQSVLSMPSDPVSYYVQRIKASRLERNNGITLEWMPQPDAVSYTIYRYNSMLDPTADLFISIDDGTAATYDDMMSFPVKPVLGGHPYFYKICWKDAGGVTYGMDERTPFFLGIFYDTADEFEPNDHWTALETVAETTLFEGKSAPITYSLTSGDIDEDWYKFYGKPESMLNVIVTTGYEGGYAGLLKLQFTSQTLAAAPDEDCTPAFKNQFTVINPITSEVAIPFYFNGFDNTADYVDQDGNIGIYIRIFPDHVTEENRIGSYQVSMSQGIP